MRKPTGRRRVTAHHPKPHLPETPPEDSPDRDKERHDHLSRDIRVTGLVLLSYSIFCFMTLSQIDEIIQTRNVQIPLADIPVKFSSFLAFGPLALIIITFYLHLFIWEWEGIKSVASEKKLPFTFNMENLPAQILSGITFYALPPVVLLFFSYRAYIWEGNMTKIWGIAAFIAFIVLFAIWLKHTEKDNLRIPSSDRPSLFIRRAFVIGFAFIGCTLASLTVSGWINNIFPLDLVRAELSDQKIARLNLNNANLYAANLSGTVFLETSLKGVNLQNANLEGANLMKVNLQSANLEEANLSGANLNGANLRLTRFRRANLKGASLARANVTDSNLRGANLEEANLQGANFKRADLGKANLKGAIITGARLAEAINLTCEQIKSATGLKEIAPGKKRKPTRLPKYLQIIWDDNGNLKDCVQ